MRVCLSLLVVLFTCVRPAAAAGQQPASASLTAAERAFAEALANHDRAAFVAMFAPDAESTLPSITRGPENIANAWLPFLIDPGTTMLLTATSATTIEGETGSSSGTLAIRGRTNNGVQTVPAGTYAIKWRLIDGRWKIAALGPSTKPSAEIGDGGSVGSYRFGMTRAEVSRVEDCTPYTPVAVTGGLECPRYRFDDREMTISFLFAGERLRRIQLWYYEGESSDDARQAVDRVLAFLRRTTGGATITARPDVPVTADGVVGALSSAPRPVGRQLVQLEICGPSDASPRWFARVGRHEHGYLVMLFAETVNR